MFPIKLLNLLKKRARRFPKIYQIDLLLEILMRTLVEAENSFLAKQSIKKLERLICLQYHFRQRILTKEEHSSLRKLEIKLFISSSEGIPTLSVALGIKLFSSQEILEEKHVYRALVSLIPGIEITPDSFYSCLCRKNSFLFCYMEVKKLRGTHLSLKDIHLLQKKLPFELRQNVQLLSFSLLFSYNEEAIFKSAITLAGELRSKSDLPQVMILFQDHIQDVLRFSVVLVRARKKTEAPFQHSQSLSSSFRLVLQRSIPLGSFKKEYLKEAIFFSIEIDHTFFLRKNWSIDLGQARNYTTKIIEQLFGPFRDYNGGLLSQQNKQLETIKEYLREKYEQFHPLIQEMFSSFSPPSFQALISKSIAQQLFSFFISCLRKKTLKKETLMTKKGSGNSLFVLLNTDSAETRDFIIEEIKCFQKQAFSSMGFTCFQLEEDHYFCFIDLNYSSKRDIVSYLKLSLQKKDKIKEEKGKALKINFQEGDPPSLNPQIAIDQRCRCLGKGLFEGLTRLNSKGFPERAAAKEIKISPCQKIYTFILREHCWSNGEEVSAYDFEQTWKRAIAPDSHCLRSDLFYLIKNARLAHHGLKSLDQVRIKALNVKTLVVELEYPAFYFLHLIAHPIFSPLYRGEQEPYHFNGPFLLKDWKRNHYLHLTSNPYYWDKDNVALKDISITMHSDVEQIEKMFERGELDWIGEPFSTSFKAVFPPIEKKLWQKKRVDQFYWIYLNTRQFPLNSAYIRKSLACAINRKQLKESFQGKPYFFDPYTTSAEGKWDGNKRLAHQFFHAGLKELNIAKENFPEIILYWSTDGEKKLVAILQRQIESTLGIRIVLKNVPWNHLSYLLDKREYSAATCYRSSPYFYPRSYLELFRENSNLYNSSQWENAKYKSLVDKALQKIEESERKKYLTEAEMILIQEMPVIPLFLPDYQYLTSHRLKKVAIASNGDVDLKLIQPKN